MPDAAANDTRPREAVIACGGTGGHLFPGLAVGQELLRRHCSVTLMVSPKEVDQQAVRSVKDMKIVTLPAVGLQRGGVFGFALGFAKSWRRARTAFSARPPQFVLAMGGFTGAPPIFASRRFAAKTFLHESNTIPGKANRWLARFVDGAFVYFAQTAATLRPAPVEVVGMPVRPQFLDDLKPAAARRALGLDEAAPALLIMGGSQGARGVNELATGALPQLLTALPQLQFLHLTGAADFETTRQAYARHNARALVQPFMSEMGLVLAAADVAVSRAGASSLAELAARRVPSILIPFPSAADDHQSHNARAFVQSGAARSMAQSGATSAHLARAVLELLQDTPQRNAMQHALDQWRKPSAAADIAEMILRWPSRALCRASSLAFKSPPVEALHA